MIEDDTEIPRATSRNVGLYLDASLDDDVSAVAALRGLRKSAVYAAGARLVLDDLTGAERAALEAMRAARGSGT